MMKRFKDLIDRIRDVEKTCENCRFRGECLCSACKDRSLFELNDDIVDHFEKRMIDFYDEMNNPVAKRLKEISFSKEDIKDPERLKRMIKKEADGIYEGPLRRGRTKEAIEQAVEQGKIAELYLIENFDYEEADIKYHDLKGKDGTYTEVKAYSNCENTSTAFAEKDLDRLRSCTWNTSTWYIVFNVVNGKYFFMDYIKIR